jgi:anti-anti-sigma factor
VVETTRLPVPGRRTLVRCTWADEYVGTASVEGPVEGPATGRLERALTGLIEAGAQTVVVDLRRCEWLDSVALGVLVRAHRKLSLGGLVLVVTTPEIVRLFQVTGLDRSIEVCRDIPDLTPSDTRAT